VARLYKRYPVAVRRVEGKQVVATVSVYDNVDLQGDVVVPGAFDASIARWVASGDPIPLVWSHDWQNPEAHVGTIDPALVQTDGRGLTIVAEFKGETEFAQQVQRLVEQRRVREWSFSYDVIRDEQGPNGETRLLELDLIEAGPTLKGANPETSTLSRGLSVTGLKNMLARERRGERDAAEEELLRRLDEIVKGAGASDKVSDRQLVDELWNELMLAAKELEKLPARIGPSMPAQAFHPAGPAPQIDGHMRPAESPAPTPAGPEEKFSANLLDAPDGQPFSGRVKSHAKEQAPEAVAVLQAVNELQNSAVRATQSGLPEDGSELTRAARALRGAASGLLGSDSATVVAQVLEDLAPIAGRMREAGFGQSADNLDVTLENLRAGVAGDVVENAEHITGTSR